MLFLGYTHYRVQNEPKSLQYLRARPFSILYIPPPQSSSSVLDPAMGKLLPYLRHIWLASISCSGEASAPSTSDISQLGKACTPVTAGFAAQRNLLLGRTKSRLDDTHQHLSTYVPLHTDIYSPDVAA
ncbi:hypothetical protein K438DRAFT_642121 [Mycena galopus ATCC 62051]|nr:hypothetical protein K438DRAFT_642121 [Mycena galopus ATCC 62051]